jgi:hypothetical protein
VGHEQDRLAVRLPDPEQQLLHQRARLVVQGAERLVEEQDLRIVRQRAREGGALLHAAGQHLRVVRLEAAQPDALDVVGRDAVLLGLRHALLPQAEADVLLHGQPGKQRVGLEHHAAVRPGPRDRLAVEQHAPGGRLIE